MSIGEVLARLRDDFPDVTISKLRFLEAEGLVEPQRTAAGLPQVHRRSTSTGCGFVLAAQRDRLPAAAGDPRAPGRARPGRAACRTLGRARRCRRVAEPAGARSRSTPARPRRRSRLRSRDELLRRVRPDRRGSSAELEDAGLVAARSPGWYDADALVIATVAAALAELRPRGPAPARRTGPPPTARSGCSPQLIAPLAQSATPAARARAAEAVRELTALSQQLHAALVRVGLRDTLGP